MALTARRAVLSDAMWLLALRNDPETVLWSISGMPVSAHEHASWFAITITDPTRALMVVEADSAETALGLVTYIATYRLDRIGSDQIEVSLTVAPEHRGRGYADRVIILAARHAMREGPESVIALVKRGNTRSLRAFLRAGFRLNPPSTDDGDLLLLAARSEDIASRVCALCARGAQHHTNAGGSIGGTDQAPRYDLHAVEHAAGVGLRECDAGDLWLAWEKAKGARMARLQGDPSGARQTDVDGLSGGSTPPASTKHQPCADADCILCPGWGARGGDDGEGE